jgi:hypothetical protein
MVVLGRSNRKPHRLRAAIILAGVGVLAFVVAELLPWVEVANPSGGALLFAVPVVQMQSVAADLYQLFLPVLLALTGRAVAKGNEAGFGAAGSAIGMACGELILLLGALAAPAPPNSALQFVHAVSYGPGAIAAVAGVGVSIAAVLVARTSRPALLGHPSATNERETPSRNADDLVVSAIDRGETI